MANSNQNISTPVPFFNAVEEYFEIKFLYDMAANLENMKCKNYFDVKSLDIDWPLDGWCWLNPPFRTLTQWIKKCKEQKDRGCKIITIWPLSGDHNQIITWTNSFVNVVHGRVWPEVRGIMLCKWDKTVRGNCCVDGLLWNGGKLERIW